MFSIFQRFIKSHVVEEKYTQLTQSYSALALCAHGGRARRQIRYQTHARFVTFSLPSSLISGNGTGLHIVLEETVGNGMFTLEC
jgi:hypothetical protein